MLIFGQSSFKFEPKQMFKPGLGIEAFETKTEVREMFSKMINLPEISQGCLFSFLHVALWPKPNNFDNGKITWYVLCVSSQT